MRLFSCLWLLILALLEVRCSTTNRGRSRPAEAVQSPEPANDEVQIGTYKTTRLISMRYRLSLFRDNIYAKQLALELNRHDPALRSCYTSGLDASPKLKGIISLRFQISKKVGALEKIKKVGGNIVDQRFTSCLVAELARVQYHPPVDLAGQVTYAFQAAAGADSVKVGMLGPVRQRPTLRRFNSIARSE